MDVSSHPAFRRRAGDGPVFTATKCPPGPGLKHTCELPFGFVWTPMSPSNTVAVVSSPEDRGEALPPVLCLTCLAYINLYATFDASSGMWTCPLCGEENVAAESIFKADSGLDANLSLALVAPVVEYRQRVGGASSIVGEVDPRSYILVLDANLPCNEVKAVITAMQTLLLDEARGGAHVQLALVVYDQMVSIYQLGLTGLASADVYPPLPVDADEEMLAQRRQRMENRSYFVQVRSQDDLATLWLCASAVYGVQVQHVNGGEPGQSSSGSGSEPLSRKERLRMRKEARLRKELSGSLEAEQTDAQPSSLESPWCSKETAPALRCTGEATQCAVELALFGSSHVPRTSRLLFFTNGCPNVGVGSIVNRDLAEETTPQIGQARPAPHVVHTGQMKKAVHYFELAGKDAMDNGIGIDVFCTGAESLGMPTYQALVRPSGGYALLHESFSSPQLAHNLGYIMSHTHMSMMDCEEGLGASTGSVSSSTSNQLDGCIVDLRMSSFVTPTHVVGPGEILYDDNQGLLANERSAFAMAASAAASQGIATNDIPSDEALASTLTRIRLGRLDPLSTMSVMLRVNEDMLPDDRYAFFQCIVRFIDPLSHNLVTRVSTNRLPMSRSVHDFLESMDEEAVPVVLGKEAVNRSVVGREEEETAVADVDRLEILAYEAQRDLDATVQRISGAFRLLGLEEGNLSDRILTEEGGIGASHSSLDFAFPPELADALHRLFHLRRGAQLSPGPLQSADDRAEMRSLFLRLPLDDCLCMMAPSLWSASMLQRDGEAVFNLEPIPSDTLTLWDNRIIAADHHDTLFVWSGRGVRGPEFDSIRDQCKEFLLERSKNRFPMPHFYVLAEGDSMSRRFTARLAPSHADPPEQQLVHFPALTELSPSELSALREKFRFYDAATDASFRRWFWGVASASSTARDEGLSLCE